MLSDLQSIIEKKEEKEVITEQQQGQSPVLYSFMYALKSTEARRQYPKRLKMLFDFLGLHGSLEEQAMQTKDTKERPAVIIRDGARNFHDAYNKEFFILKKPRTRHIAHIMLQGDHNNNKMERLNGEIRDREKVMRGLKKEDTPILVGYQIFHNYIREHEALDGKTPAEAAGIKIEGENRW